MGRSEQVGPCMCGATDCRSCGPAQGYRVGPGIDKTELQHRVEQRIEAELSGESSLYADLIGELTTCEGIPENYRPGLYNCRTYGEAMLLAAYRGHNDKALRAVQLLEARIRDRLIEWIEPEVRAEMED